MATIITDNGFDSREFSVSQGYDYAYFNGYSSNPWRTPPTYNGVTYNDEIIFPGYSRALGTGFALAGYTVDPVWGDIRGGYLAEGTVQVLILAVPNTDGVLSFAAAGLSLAAMDLTAAMASTDRADDRVLLSRILSGDDVVTLSVKDDHFESFDGNDWIYAGDGDDTVYGGAGKDVINAGADDDMLFGDDGRDVLNGVSGSDVYTGGAGADVFVMSAGGRDTITDFEDGIDKIRLSKLAHGFDELQIRQVGADVLVRVGSLRLTIEDISVSHVTSSDFVFA